ncbi:MAG: signal peptidase I [Candidatus Latescibacterota bacterium]|nr:signal peptidase I [Candidatus Latescibacterota bacterium]
MDKTQSPLQKRPTGAREYGSSILIAVALALFIRSTVVQAFYIPSGSMEDTLFVGDYLLANKFVYGAPLELPLVSEPLLRLPALRDPQPSDIVIFRSKTEPDRDLIKRCVAVGGQTVKVKNKILYVDGEPFPLPPDSKHMDPRVLRSTESNRDNFGPYKVPEDSFFMMGDNRDNSNDSRVFGAVPRHLIKGKAMIIYWSSKLISGPLFPAPKKVLGWRFTIPQLVQDVGNFLWNLPTLPFRSRYGRLGIVIH